MKTTKHRAATADQDRRKLLQYGTGSALSTLTRHTGAGMLAGLGVALSGPARAQAGFPSRPVKLIVPFPPGQATDIFARMLAEKLQPIWGHNVVVENRGGGGGVPAMEAVRLAQPDGHTLGMGTSGTIGINPVVYSKLPYDVARDFATITNVIIAPLVMVAHPSLGIDSMAQLISYAKKNPGKLNYASAGPGASQHMAAELLKSRAGIFLVHIPYRGSGPAMTDLLGGQIPLMFDSVSSALPHIQSGRLKALGVATAKRVSALPNVPAISEVIPGFEATGWAGMIAPKATPPELIAKISNDVQAILRDPAVMAEIERRGSIADPMTPKRFSDFVAAENKKWGEVARIANVKLD
jgi:tripartite-type tricarboxylate transporter receptor subunit TctC